MTRRVSDRGISITEEEGDTLRLPHKMKGHRDLADQIRGIELFRVDRHGPIGVWPFRSVVWFQKCFLTLSFCKKFTLQRS